jgi:tRNA threonylcarbamoyl adenosine modification protein YeaZ
VTVLAIDTASRLRALVLRTDAGGAILAEREVAGGRLDQLLPAAIAELLDDSVAAVVVLTGPGSYTGVRAGMAAGLGVAMARGLPLYGAGNLQAIAVVALADGGETLMALADAGRGGVFTARFARRGAEIEQVSAVERRAAATLQPSAELAATTAIDGITTRLVPPRTALAAAVPWALARPPLSAAGLAATHARAGGADLGAAEA